MRAKNNIKLLGWVTYLLVMGTAVFGRKEKGDPCDIFSTTAKEIAQSNDRIMLFGENHVFAEERMHCLHAVHDALKKEGKNPVYYFEGAGRGQIVHHETYGLLDYYKSFCKERQCEGWDDLRASEKTSLLASNHQKTFYKMALGSFLQSVQAGHGFNHDYLYRFVKASLSEKTTLTTFFDSNYGNIYFPIDYKDVFPGILKEYISDYEKSKNKATFLKKWHQAIKKEISEKAPKTCLTTQSVNNACDASIAQCDPDSSHRFIGLLECTNEANRASYMKERDASLNSTIQDAEKSHRQGPHLFIAGNKHVEKQEKRHKTYTMK